MRTAVHWLAMACAVAALAAPAGLTRAPARAAAAPAQAAAAQAVPTQAVPAQAATATATAGVAVCTITDGRATELSGLVATADGYVAINDGQWDPADTRIFYLDQRCRVTRTLSYPTAARDPEDLAVAPDGALWVADIGDNVTGETRRTTIALWHVPGEGRPHIYRLSYPDGPHDAEALLITGDGVPLIVTKELAGAAGLYRPAAALKAGTAQGVPLELVGTFTPRAGAVDNPLGALGEGMVTGAARSPDGGRVALRTYSAAYEWDVPDGDVVKAITTGTPRITELPDEPQGEAIAYTVDGLRFLTLSDEAGPTTIRRYDRSTVPATTQTPGATAAVPAGPPQVGGIPWIGFFAGLGGVLLVVAGVLGVRLTRRGNRSRHRRRAS